MAIANPVTRDSGIVLLYRDANGANFGQGTTTTARGQIAAFLNQAPFNGGDRFRHIDLCVFHPHCGDCAGGFTNERGEFLITTLPIVDIGAPSSSDTTIPHFAAGGGWTTQVLLVNPSDSVLNGVAQFLGTSGEVIQTSPYRLGPGSSARIVFEGVAGAETDGALIRTGSVRISPGPNSLAIFSYKTNGVTVTQAGVPVLPPAAAFRTYVESAGVVQSGIAVANPSDAAAAVSFDLNGVTASVVIPAGGQTAMFLNEIAGFANWRGVLRITSAAAIAVTGLPSHVNERGEFLITTTTPMDESNPPAAAELFFPHFAEGGGYNMQFILFGRASSGTLYFFDQAGNLAPLLFR
jgi:hypothetical protein